MGLHRRYAGLLAGADQQLLAASASEVNRISEELSHLFRNLMKVVHSTEGASFSVELLATDQAQAMIGAHAAALDSSFRKVEMSEAMRRRLHRSDYIFSGMKVFHEMNEAFPALVGSDGNLKPFEQFYKEVSAIHDRYNRHYLRAEYNFVHASAQMAARWEEFAADGDDYNLQYRTAGDNRVREEHRALDGVTLPFSDPFWEEFLPPNGWNCRCSVVQVRKSKYPVTDAADARRRGEQALQRDTRGMFRFNPGTQQKTVPDYNPYTISACRSCPAAKGKSQLAKPSIPQSELCEACKTLRNRDYYTVVEETNGLVEIHAQHGKNEKAENIMVAKYLASKYGWKIKLLPKDDSKPCADSYNETLGYEQEYKVNYTPTKNSIDGLLRKGKTQADNIVLVVESDISLGDLRDAIQDRINRSPNVSTLMLVIGEKDFTYTREDIILDSFKIRREDFK